MYKNKIIRILLIIIGFVSLALGSIGIIIPILPTVPFLLLTSFCFLKSSLRFNKRFLNSKIYKKYLENFQKNKIMPLWSMTVLIVFVSSILLLSMFFINNLVMTIVFSILIFFKCLYFALMIKPVSSKEFTESRAKLASKN